MNGNFIITGAAGGFGREFSSRVLKSGGKVVLADKNVELGKQTYDEFSAQFGAKSCLFVEHDVTDRESWKQMWQQAENFLNNIDVLVNNAGVSPKLGFDICMKINFDGVLNGIHLFEEKFSKRNGGKGGLIINTASVAGLSHTNHHDAISYWVAKCGVVSMTREFGRCEYKTGIKHVALCPWFAETAIVDPTTKDMVMKKSPLKFVSVDRVGEAFELAVKEQRTGGVIAVLPNVPLTYYPDTLQMTGLIVYFISKFLQLFGVETVEPRMQGLVLFMFCSFMTLFVHLLLSYFGF